MKLIDNINDLLGDDFKSAIKPGARLKIAASCFSIYAFEALKRELEMVESFDFIFTSPSVKINVEQIFKLMSPGTDVKTI